MFIESRKFYRHGHIIRKEERHITRKIMNMRGYGKRAAEEGMCKFCERGRIMNKKGLNSDMKGNRWNR